MNVSRFKKGAVIQQFSREPLLYFVDSCAVRAVFDYFEAGVFKAGKKSVAILAAIMF